MMNPYEQLARLMRIKAMLQAEITQGCSKAAVVEGRLCKGSTIVMRSEETGLLYRMTISAGRPTSYICIAKAGGREYMVSLRPNGDSNAPWSIVPGWDL